MSIKTIEKRTRHVPDRVHRLRFQIVILSRPCRYMCSVFLCVFLCVCLLFILAWNSASFWRGRQAKSIRNCHRDGPWWKRDQNLSLLHQFSSFVRQQHAPAGSSCTREDTARASHFRHTKSRSRRRDVISWKETINISGSLYCDKYCVRFSF